MNKAVFFVVVLSQVLVLTTCDLSKPTLQNLILSKGASQSKTVRQGKDYTVPDYSKYPPNNAKPDPFANIKEHFSNKFPSQAEVQSTGEVGVDQDKKKAITITAVLLGSAALIILGLILIFPAVTFLPTFISIPMNRRRRSTDMADEEEDLKSRVQNIFMAVVQSEECMEKVICEVEGLVGDNYKDYIHSISEKLTNTRFGKLMKAFKEGRNSPHCKQRKCSLVSNS